MSSSTSTPARWPRLHQYPGSADHWTPAALLLIPPSKDNPYWGFGSTWTGTAKVVASDAIDAAQTYDALRDAIATASRTGCCRRCLSGWRDGLPGAEFSSRYDTESGKLVSVPPMLLTDSNGGKVTIDANTGWQTKNGVVPPSSGLHTKIEPFDPLDTVDLVTSRSSSTTWAVAPMAAIWSSGGLSVDTTSSSKGVERFEIKCATTASWPASPPPITPCAKSGSSKVGIQPQHHQCLQQCGDR